MGERGAQADQQGRRPSSRKPAAKEGIFYLFRLLHALTGDGADRLELGLAKARLKADGSLADQGAEWSNYEQALLKPPPSCATRTCRFPPAARHRPPGGAAAARCCAAPKAWPCSKPPSLTGRTYLALDDSGHSPPSPAARPARAPNWQPAPGGLTRPADRSEPRRPLASHRPPAYLDADRWAKPAGSTPDSGAAIAEVLALPPLSPIELPVVASALAEVAPALPSALAPAPRTCPCLDAPCQPVLNLHTLHCWAGASTAATASTTPAKNTTWRCPPSATARPASSPAPPTTWPPCPTAAWCASSAT